MRIFVTLTTGLILVLALSTTAASTAEAGKPTPILSYTDRVWGDVLCSGQVDESDAIPVLEWLSQAPDNDAPDGCPLVFFGVAVDGYLGDWRWGDVDCGGGVGPLDVLAILRAAASLSSVPSNGCPTIAQTYPVAIVGK